jgi:phosphoenolpyruvate carboxykinase (ATP)
MAEDQKSIFSLDYLEISGIRKAYWNLSTDGYIQESLYRNEGLTSKHGALVVLSGERTSRSAKDKFIVREPGS